MAVTELTPAQVHGSWRARHRASNLERIAKAIHERYRNGKPESAGGVDIVPWWYAEKWDKASPEVRKFFMDLAEAAYDAL